VTLHFAEVRYQEPGRRNFDVYLSGKPFLTQYEPFEAGFARAARKACRVDIREGLLEIRFVAGKDCPEISALEIETAE
jgi:hypothetical protein